MHKLLVTAVLAVGLAAPASAQSIFGSGGLACKNWTANLKRKWPHLADTDWLMGYISGVNTGRGPGSRMMANANVQAATGFPLVAADHMAETAVPDEAALAVIARLDPHDIRASVIKDNPPSRRPA